MIVRVRSSPKTIMAMRQHAPKADAAHRCTGHYAGHAHTHAHAHGRRAVGALKTGLPSPSQHSAWRMPALWEGCSAYSPFWTQPSPKPTSKRASVSMILAF
ncbi:hypothetical protein QF032_007752 [Streptomyces achromogenes]|uniref:Uncharacterized protein n=1 Tax=Streptomyces achromogenes TaxID=67255 RepID=A0ABU0QDI1_STRAH|nr:hypothetical protein [Streptomyces achromogenes]MDQ0835908.1 hypothetical protein [Streptomyces achromogenes]